MVLSWKHGECDDSMERGSHHSDFKFRLSSYNINIRICIVKLRNIK